MTEIDHTAALAALKAEITAGWRVKITDHDYGNGSRDDVTVIEVRADRLTLRPKRPWSSQGRSFSTMNFTWWGDKEVTGRTVNLFHTPPPHTGKSRRLIKTFTFIPPEEH
jgi:hypothetical protein